MIVTIIVEREGKTVASVKKEMSDEILTYERQRQFQIEETIRNFVPEIVSKIINDYEIDKKLTALSVKPRTTEVEEEINSLVTKKLGNIFSEEI